MRKIAIIAGFLLCAIPAFAQQTSVQATITDPNGNPYTFLTGTATIVCPGNAQPYINTSPILQPSQPIVGGNGLGKFTAVLYDENVMTAGQGGPTTCLYRFNITWSDNKTNFITGLISGITGAGPVDLSAAISAYAVPLPSTVPSIGTYTVATLPSHPFTNTVAIVSDGSGASCTVGSGTSRNLCQFNGSSWVYIGSPSTGCTISGGTQNAVVTTNPSNTCNPVPVTADSSGNLIVPANSTFGGPNPTIDITSTHARTISSPYSTTCAISASSSVATVGSNTGMQVNDGVNCQGAGATNTLTTPTGLAVTSVVATGPLGQNKTSTNTNTGSTTYSYEVAAVDEGGGVTAVGSVSFSTGLPIGQQSATVSTATRSGTTVTLNTSASETVSAGTHIEYEGSSDQTFNGQFLVATTPSGTSLTYSGPQTTVAGATASATGGTIKWFQGNHITWTDVSGSYQYCIYNGSTGAFINATPVNITTGGRFAFTWFDDYGFAAGPQGLCPATAPSVATNDNLITTITNISGTSITLANAATNTAPAGAFFKFDDEPNIKATYAAASALKGAVRWPCPTVAGQNFYTNSVLDLRAYSLIDTQICGKVFVGQTIFPPLSGNVTSFGAPISSSQFAFGANGAIVGNGANPVVDVTISSTAQRMEKINITNPFDNGHAIEDEGLSDNFIANDVSVITGTGSGTDYLGDCLTDYGNYSVSLTNFYCNNSTTNTNFLTTAPGIALAVGLNPPGNFSATGLSMFPRGVSRCLTSGSGAAISIAGGTGISQGLIEPIVTLCDSTANDEVSISSNYTNDTEDSEAVVNLGSTINKTLFLNNLLSSTAIYSTISGYAFESVFITGNNLGNPNDFGQNFNVVQQTNSGAASVNQPNYGLAPGGLFLVREMERIPSHSLDLGELGPVSGVSGSPASGGSLTVGTWDYIVLAYGFELPTPGETGAQQPGVTIVRVVTTSGNQTASLSWSALTGAQFYSVYRCLASSVTCNLTSSLGNFNAVNACFQTKALSCNDTGGSAGDGIPPTFSGTGQTTLNGSGEVSPLVSANSLNNALAFTNLYPGTDMSLQIQNRLAALPTANTQAEVNARGYTTSQTISVNPFANMTTNPASIIFDAPCVNTTQNAQISETVSDFVWNGCGTGGSASLFAGASFPASTPMVSLGSSSLLRQHVDFRDTRIDCNAGTGPNTCTPILLSNLQEFSVTERTNAVGANSSTSTGPAVEVTDPNGGGHWTMRDTAIAKSGDNDGIYLHLEGSTGGLLERTTVDNTGFNSGTNCGEIDSIDGNPTFADIIDFHCEGFTNGLQLDAHAGASAMGVDSTGTNTTLINIASGAGLFAGSFLYSSSATNIVVDASLASTLTLTRSSYPNGIGYYTNGAIFGNTIVDTGVTGSTQCAQFNSSGQLSGTGSACGSGGGGVTSVSNSDSTLTISPTTGAVVASLNLAHANTWTANQTAPGFLASGSGAGYFQCTGGTAPSLVASTFQLTCPASVTTNYQVVVPAAAATGIPHWSNLSNTVTETVSAVNLGNSDVTGNLPLTNLATQAADTVLMNATGSSASPTAVAMPTTGTNGCAGATNALTYNTTSHALGCNTISGGSGGGGTVTYTSSQTASTSDNGKLVLMNCSSACAYTLPATQPSTTFFVRLMSIGSTLATVGLSGDTWNGTAVTPVLNSSAPLTIYADSATSTNYAGNPSLTSFPTASQTIKSSAVGVTPLILNTPASPTADIFDVDINGSKQFFFDSSGNMNLSGPNIQSTSGSSLLIRALNQVLTLNATGGGGNGIRSGGAPYQQAVNSIAFSTTPALDLSLGNVQQFSCTTSGASVSPTFSNPFKGDSLTVIFIQNGTTACTWTWPATIHGGGTVTTTLSGISVQTFVVSNNGTDAYAISTMQNMTGGTP